LSWDIFIQDLPQHAKTLDDIPDDFKPAVIGTRSDLIHQIKEFAGSANFGDPSWGSFDGPGFSVDFSMGDEEECTCIALHVYGGGDDAVVAFVAGLLEHLGLRAFDPSSPTGIFAMDASLGGFERWKSYLDQSKRHSD
jgi:hypothetical protein